MEHEMHGRQEICENSSNPIASEIEIGENSSNLITSETAIEVRSGETECCTGEDRSSKEISENPSEPVVSETVIEVRSVQCECPDTEIGSSKGEANAMENRKVTVEEPRVNVPLVDDKYSDGELNGGNRDSDKVCRICHLSSDRRPDALDLIQLGCGCKGELGTVHRHCAETWFKMKGNRCCEICSETAKNITVVGDNRFMEWSERRMLGTNSSRSSERGRCWRGQPFCNFLMACLVIAFILPWFFRVNMF